ncbi:MAG: desulfoferrodoxin family protein [Candidatus Thorarchaeota archaeon]
MSDKIDLFKGINRVMNPETLTNLEKQHKVSIEVPDKVNSNVSFDVELAIGHDDPHPHDPDHFIQYIELFSGEALVSRYEMPAVTINIPSIKVTIQLPGWADSELVVRARCNLHGIWEARRKIQLV